MSQNTYKIIEVGSRKAKHIFCGREIMDRAAFDLVTRMKGATIESVEEPGFSGFDRTASVKAGPMARHTVYSNGKKETYVTIALSPEKADSGEPLIAVKIPKSKFGMLRKLLGDA